MAEQYRSNRKKKQTQSAPELQFVEGFIGVIASLIGMLFKGVAGKGKPAVDRQKLQTLLEPWQQVELHALQPQTYVIAISEADKILDNAMKLLGASGETMADRLRSFQERFGQELYQQIWEAHKLRNTLAHEVGASATANQVQSAVTAFRTALYQLGVFE